MNQARKIIYCPSEFTWDLIEALPKAYYYHVNGIPYEVYSKNELQPFYFFSQLKASNHTPAFQKSAVYDFEGPEYITDEWLPPPLKSFYKVDIPFDKPTVVVNNKYSEEWKKPPENYLDLEDLDRIFSALKDRFNIIYIRAEGREKDYFNDDNKILDFGDFDFIDEKHSYVVSSRKLAKVYPELSFNTLQCVLLATSKRHISIAGGNAVLSSYFGGTNIVVCKCNVCISREIWSTDSYLTKLSGSKIVGLTNISSIENEIGAWQMYIHKNGIELKKMESRHLPLMKELKDESWFGTHHITIVNHLDQQKWFENLNNDSQLFLIASDTQTKEEVGVYKVSHIDWTSRNYHSAHDVFKAFRGKGYGKTVLEAGVDFGMEVLNMNRIDTEVLENNIASRKTAEYVGYIHEGTRRKAVHKCGEYLDSNFYGLLREDWRALERVKRYEGICNISYQPKNKKVDERRPELCMQ